MSQRNGSCSNTAQNPPQPPLPPRRPPLHPGRPGWNGEAADPLSDPTQIEVGGAEVHQAAHRSDRHLQEPAEYQQAPWLDKLVAAGKLPPVEKRLPKEPPVYLTTGMKDGIGVYGDLWRGFSACPTAGYNDMAGTTMGWFGIEVLHLTLRRAGQDWPAVPR